jgi:hypothetical protein
LAALTLITREALTLTTRSVTDTLVCSFSIFVVASKAVRGINPSQLKGADSLRAVTREVRQAETPVVEALANALLTAASVTGAGVITAGLDRRNKRHKHNDRLDHLYNSIKLLGKATIFRIWCGQLHKCARGEALLFAGVS